jgi:hypothetical protein
VVLHIVPPEPYILGIGTPVPKASRHGMEQKLAGAIDCYLLARKSTHGTARRGALEERYRDDNDCTRSDFLHLSF